MYISELLKEFNLTTAGPLSGDFQIQSVRPLNQAGPEDLSFLSNPKYKGQALKSRAGAILVSRPIDGATATQILCDEPYVVLARVLRAMYPEPDYPEERHPTAVIAQDVQVGPGCYIGPHCVVESGTVIGPGCVLTANVTVSSDCMLGEEVKLFPGVVLYSRTRLGNRVRIHANSVIGGDGFGYAQHRGRHEKIPQIGGVHIGDDVEIGANTSIDRGALSDTVIGKGTKIDNQVQVGHGVKIGEHGILVSQTGISGSVTTGNHVILAGRVGIVGHVTLGDHVLVMGDAVVTKDLNEPGQYAGNPAVPHMKYQRQLAFIRRLPELQARLKELEHWKKERDHD